MTMKKRTLRVVLQVNSQLVTRPPSRKSPKRGGIPAHPPLFGVARESPGPRDEVGI